jgi:hypothetical protein
MRTGWLARLARNLKRPQGDAVFRLGHAADPGAPPLQHAGWLLR